MFPRDSQLRTAASNQAFYLLDIFSIHCAHQFNHTEHSPISQFRSVFFREILSHIAMNSPFSRSTRFLPGTTHFHEIVLISLIVSVFPRLYQPVVSPFEFNPAADLPFHNSSFYHLRQGSLILEKGWKELPGAQSPLAVVCRRQ